MSNTKFHMTNRLGEPCDAWISLTDELPPNDYEYDLFILFKDGSKAYSNGGTVCDDNGNQITHWMYVRNAVYFLPNKQS